MSTKLKDQGNKLFQKKQYALAAAKYSEAIDLDDKSAVLYSNRAACRLNLGQYLDANDDAQRAVQLDPSYTKAWARLATAYRHLELPDACIDAWQEAIATLPEDSPDSSVFNQKKEYQECLRAAEELREGWSKRQSEKCVVSVDDSPWTIAEKLLRDGLVENPDTSNAYLIVEAHKRFQTGVAKVNKLKVTLLKDGSELLVGDMDATNLILDAVMIDERVFHINGQTKQWPSKFAKQARLEVREYQVDEYVEMGPSLLIEKLREIAQSEGWSRVRRILDKVIRLWIVQGFLLSHQFESHDPAKMKYAACLEVLNWALVGCNDTSREGSIFYLPFIWRLQALHLGTSLATIPERLNAESRIQALEQMFNDADDLIKTIEKDPLLTVPDQVTPLIRQAYCMNSMAVAYAVQGYYHCAVAEMELDKKEVAQEHKHKSSRMYRTSAMHYPRDDQRHSYYLKRALDDMWLSSTGTFGEATQMMREYITSREQMLKIWSHALNVPNSPEYAKQIELLERVTLEKLASGEATLRDFHHPWVILPSKAPRGVNLAG